jgi:hypothetical protein
LKFSQQPASGSDPQPVQSSSHPFTLLKKQSNIILPSMPRSSEWSLFFRRSKQSFANRSHNPNACYMASPPAPHLFDCVNKVCQRTQRMKFFVFSFCIRTIRSPQHPVFKHPDTLSPYSCLNARGKVSYQYKTTDKTIVSYILIFKFVESRREDKRFRT